MHFTIVFLQCFVWLFASLQRLSECMFLTTFVWICFLQRLAHKNGWSWLLRERGQRSFHIPLEIIINFIIQTQRYGQKDCFGNLIEVLSNLTLNAVCSEGSHQGVALPLPVQVHYLEQGLDIDRWPCMQMRQLWCTFFCSFFVNFPNCSSRIASWI